jgi:hypothetical protein
VQESYDRWRKAGSKGEFIDHLGDLYCPIGADNDPTGLNRHWKRNVRHFKRVIERSENGMLEKKKEKGFTW